MNYYLYQSTNCSLKIVIHYMTQPTHIRLFPKNLDSTKRPTFPRKPQKFSPHRAKLNHGAT